MLFFFFLVTPSKIYGASPMIRWVKESCMQETQETQVWSLGWEDPLKEGDPLEEETATLSRIFAWKIPCIEKPSRLRVAKSQIWLNTYAFHGVPSGFPFKAAKEKGMKKDNVVGCHHWLNRHEFEQTVGDGKGQGKPVCCSPLGCKE